MTAIGLDHFRDELRLRGLSHRRKRLIENRPPQAAAERLPCPLEKAFQAPAAQEGIDGQKAAFDIIALEVERVVDVEYDAANGHLPQLRFDFLKFHEHGTEKSQHDQLIGPFVECR